MQKTWNDAPRTKGEYNDKAKLALEIIESNARATVKTSVPAGTPNHGWIFRR